MTFPTAPSDQAIWKEGNTWFTYSATDHVWTQSDPTLASNPILLRDDFIAQSTEAGEIGELGWSTLTGTVAAQASTTLGSVVGVVRFTSNTTGASVNSLFLGSTGATPLIASGDIDTMIYRVKAVSAAADFDIRVGWTNDLTSATPTAGVYFEKLAADTTWFAVARMSGTQTRTAMATLDTSFHTFLISQTGPGTSVTFQIDKAGTPVTITTNVPTTSTAMCPGLYISPTTTTARSFDIDTFTMRSVPLPARW